VLSHLFAQGVVSATAFIGDAKFRQEVNQLLPTGMRIKALSRRPTAADYEVAYVIASRSLKPLSLPFFSRVTLRNAEIQLSNLGFHVSLTKVQVS